MTTPQFGKALSERYKGATTVELQDIAEVVSSLNDGGRDVLWKAFLASYEYATTPKPAVFGKLIDKHGIEAKLSTRTQRVGEYVCYLCGTRFPLEHRVCPQCRNHDRAWIAVIFSGDIRRGKLKHEEDAEREQSLQDRTRRLA
jgi:hypothetical protein